MNQQTAKKIVEALITDLTALFVIALYHWWIGDHLNARSALRVAVKVATMSAQGDA